MFCTTLSVEDIPNYSTGLDLMTSLLVFRNQEGNCIANCIPYGFTIVFILKSSGSYQFTQHKLIRARSFVCGVLHLVLCTPDCPSPCQSMPFEDND